MNPLKRLRTNAQRPHLTVSVLPTLHTPETLRQAQERLGAGLDQGLRCPCCGQYAKLYRRKLNSGMAASLVAFYRVGPEWLKVPDAFRSTSLVTVLANREYPKLRFWGLLEQRGSVASQWRITWDGRAFCEGKLLMPRHIFLYDGKPVKPVGVEVPVISIRDALGDRFNYDELMQRAL